jgi:predicted nuclease with RNAse H fold
MGVRRILVANELTSYRQTIAIVLRELHLNVEVLEVHPETLDREVARLGPDLVICSRVTAVVRERAANWIELYPECSSFSTFCIGGERRAMEDVQLSDLLSVCARVL